MQRWSWEPGLPRPCRRVAIGLGQADGEVSDTCGTIPTRVSANEFDSLKWIRTHMTRLRTIGQPVVYALQPEVYWFESQQAFVFLRSWLQSSRKRIFRTQLEL